MKKCLIALFLLFSTVALAKTWEVNLRSCDGYGGFWFPNHNWTDKGEPWIKPLSQGESLEKYRETGVFFNYLYPTVDCPLDSFDPDFDSDWCVESNLNNHFDVRFTPTSSDNVGLIKDSIFYFIGCSGKKNCDKDLSLDVVTDAVFVSNVRGFVSYFFPKGDSVNWDFFVPYVPPIIAEAKTNTVVNRDSIGYTILAFDDFWGKEYSSKNGMYFVYKKISDKFEYYALCNWDVLLFPGQPHPYFFDDGNRRVRALQCEFQDDGTLNFDKLPDVKTIPEDFCSTQFIPTIRLSRFKQRNNYGNQSFYKVNGTPAFKNASNIIIKSKQSILQLKGEH
jgi:hypothetical protein